PRGGARRRTGRGPRRPRGGRGGGRHARAVRGTGGKEGPMSLHDEAVTDIGDVVGDPHDGLDGGARERSDGHVVSVRDLVVRLGRKTVLDGVSLDVAAGEVVVLLGENGVGK